MNLHCVKDLSKDSNFSVGIEQSYWLLDKCSRTGVKEKNEKVNVSMV